MYADRRYRMAAFSIRQDWTDTRENAERKGGKGSPIYGRYTERKSGIYGRYGQPDDIRHNERCICRIRPGGREENKNARGVGSGVENLKRFYTQV